VDPSGHKDYIAGFGMFVLGVLSGWAEVNSFGLVPDSGNSLDALSVYDSDFMGGRLIGNGIAGAQGIAEIGIGGAGTAGGVLECVPTAGTGCALSAGSVVLATHGVGVATNALKKGYENLHLLSKSGRSESDVSVDNLYPSIIDPRTGKSINRPNGELKKVDQNKRVGWDGKQDRARFIKEWHDKGYATPEGGWDQYDVHHIKPRAYGGTNDFDNLVPVKRSDHELFNRYWERYGQ
jgi:hypothetical protein